MHRKQNPIPEEVARSIWRRASQLQAEAEHRLEESLRLPPDAGDGSPAADALYPDDIRAAGEQAGISPEFVEIALAESSAAGVPASAMTRWDALGARLFLGATQPKIEATTTAHGTVDSVSAAVLQVFSGHPCLLQTGEVADLPSSSGRVIVFKVPRYDWSATANPPFVEKAAMVGLKQLHVAVRPLPVDSAACEVLVSGDLHSGMRRQWRWSAATSVGATAAGGAMGAGIGASAVAGALLVLPAVLGAAVVSGATVGVWALTYRYYRGAVEAALRESLELLPAATRAIASTRGRRSLRRSDRDEADPARGLPG